MTDNSNLVDTSVRFFKKLQKNNNKKWFTEHKSEYEEEIKKPAEFFANILAHELEEIFDTSFKPKVFRIYRDIRFSKDKTPYNTHLHIGFYSLSEAKFSPGWFLGISPDQFVCGCGIMELSGQALVDYRNYVAGPKGAQFSDAIENMKSCGMRIDAPELKRIPTGFDKQHPRGELLKYKKMTIWKDMAEIFIKYDGDLLQASSATFKEMKPFYRYMKDIN